ncbi:uncharacterized protein Z518_06465 [Rhinocladiella mackenziei CBS 650.93]|uniref:Zn(2)-C6 fungal-type domain-containing protein n=1 Tax=Rhinocladiella mackenziei CBS 650.93 TaxID=1442369 RepID=A0A0D2H5B3_9EURO|nr:uncharacterized protein Z518_06465 [Rhinocladiella mackenziei CBS 650.93]KIX05593.1 hypothetical protein Z518_06465 [Rhinocladiella mackenziei CBS 650.93]
MSPVQATQGQRQDSMVQLASNSPTIKKGRSRGDAVQATRQSDDFHSPDAQSGLRKRKRIRLACRSCRTRKQRCDGLQPKCSHCKLQKLDCCYESASQKAEVSQLYVHNLLMRIENLEGEVEAERSRNRFAASGPHRDESSDFAQQPPISEQGSNKNRTDDENVGLPGAYPTPESLELPVKCCLGPTSNISFLETLLTPNQEQQQQPGRGRARGLASTAKGVDMASQPPSSQTFANLSSLADSWPQRHLGDYLVECYMNLCYPQYPFLHGPTIQERYESIWTAKERQSNLWTGTINIVFALGCQFSPDISPHLGQEFFKKATSLIDFDLRRSGTLETLQALILMSLYLQSSVNLEHSWNIIGVAVRQAQSLGLHLSNTYKSSWTPLARETRKRAWWACYVLDSTSGIMLGRPQMISDDHHTWVDLPAISDEELSMNGAKAAPPSSHASAADLEPSESWTDGKPSELTFFIATIRLCGLMREVTKVYDCPFDHSRVLGIDEKLCEWIAQFSPNRSPKIESNANKKFWRQRQVLVSR